jgi:hypothetical protein
MSPLGSCPELSKTSQKDGNLQAKVETGSAGLAVKLLLMRPNGELKMTTFKAWFNENLKDDAASIASHGADCGFPHITYTSDTVELFDRFGDEIWEMAADEARNLGYPTISAFISDFRRKDMMESLDQFKNLMVWFACEKLACELEDELADSCS